MSKNESRKLPFILWLISLLLHLFVFAALSNQYVWTKRTQTSRAPRFRVVSVEQPKKKLPSNLKSRFLSNANRKESGSGKTSKAPLLKRESRDMIPSRRGAHGTKVAALPPVPKSRFPAPVVPLPRPISPKEVVSKPEPEQVREKSEERKPSETSKKRSTPSSVETARLEPVPQPLPQAPSPVPPERIKPKRNPKTDKKPGAKRVVPRGGKKDKRKPEPAVKKKAQGRIARQKPVKEKKKVRVVKKKRKKSRVAALQPTPQQIREQPPVPKRPQPQDPLDLFRVKPQHKGNPHAPRLDLSDEDMDRIAKKSLDKDMKKQEGETISLDTRDFRYASYFAHIKRKIQNAWIWPVEAQKYRGRLLLRFALKKNGDLEEVRLMKSTGIRILDDLAMAAVTRAAPFDPFPAAIRRLPIEATFTYE